MAVKTLFLAASAFAGAALVAAQAAPNWQYIPVACQSQCSQTIEASYTCQNQYSGDTTNIYGCFCNNYPSDADDCASCLNSNNAAALGSLLTSTKTACPQAQKQCFFQCSFDTCPQGDVNCACQGSYLANIYNCASCNTANNNAGTTQISDFEALQKSCQAQNYTGAAQSFTTKALPVASTAGYVAPSLTATGGGAAATGDASMLGVASGTPVTGAAGTTAATGTAPTTMSGAAGSSTSAGSMRASASGSSRASASASGAAAGASSAAPSGAAGMLSAPALGGLLGLAGAVAALF